MPILPLLLFLSALRGNYTPTTPSTMRENVAEGTFSSENSREVDVFVKKSLKFDMFFPKKE